MEIDMSNASEETGHVFGGIYLIAIIYWIFAYPVADYTAYKDTVNKFNESYISDCNWEYKPIVERNACYQYRTLLHEKTKEGMFDKWLADKKEAFNNKTTIFPYVEENSK